MSATAGRSIPGAAAWPALFGMIKPPRVACTYTLNAPGPTLKTLLAELAPTNEQRLTKPWEGQRGDPEYQVQVDSGRTWRSPVGKRVVHSGHTGVRISDNSQNRATESNSASAAGLRSRTETSGVEVESEGDAPAQSSSFRSGSTLLHAPGHLVPVVRHPKVLFCMAK